MRATREAREGRSQRRDEIVRSFRNRSGMPEPPGVTDLRGAGRAVDISPRPDRIDRPAVRPSADRGAVERTTRRRADGRSTGRPIREGDGRRLRVTDIRPSLDEGSGEIRNAGAGSDGRSAPRPESAGDEPADPGRVPETAVPERPGRGGDDNGTRGERRPRPRDGGDPGPGDDGTDDGEPGAAPGGDGHGEHGDGHHRRKHRHHHDHHHYYYWAPWYWLSSPGYFRYYRPYGYWPAYSCWYAYHYGYTYHTCRPFRTCVPWYCSSPPYPFAVTGDYIGYAAGVGEGEPCPTTMAQAWNLLSRGFRDEALDAFTCHVEADPFDGLPKIGSALAAGQLGRADEAVRSMRDAIRLDPEALLYVPVRDGLEEQIDQLIDEYDDRARTVYGDLDALLMVASLNFLLGRDPLALYVLDVAVQLGDDDPGTEALRRLVESALDDAAEPVPPSGGS